MTKQPCEIPAPKTLKDRSGELYEIKISLGYHEAPSILEGSFKVATKLKHELPIDIYIHVKTQEVSQNTDLDM